eukprot:s86_g24.t1
MVEQGPCLLSEGSDRCALRQKPSRDLASLNCKKSSVFALFAHSVNFGGFQSKTNVRTPPVLDVLICSTTCSSYAIEVHSCTAPPMRLFSLLGLLAFVSCHGNLLQDELILLQRTNGGGLVELSPEELLAEDEEGNYNDPNQNWLTFIIFHLAVSERRAGASRRCPWSEPMRGSGHMRGIEGLIGGLQSCEAPNIWSKRKGLSEGPAALNSSGSSIYISIYQKKLRMENEGAQRWSWPYRVDEIAGSGLGDCLAITDDTRQITWSELSRASKVVAKSLKKLGLTGTPQSAYRRNGEPAEAPAPMVTMLPHNLESVIILLGVLRQGFPLLPLSITHNNRTQLLSRYEDAMLLFEPVAAVVTDTPSGQNLMMELKNFRPVLQVISASDLLNGETSVEDYEDVVTTTDHVLSYIFTSGSTGKSKCVVATNRMAWAECQWYPELFQKLGYQVDPRKDRWRLDHEMGWWGAAFFGEVDVALAMAMCIVMMKPTDPDWGRRGVTVSGALPSQNNLVVGTPVNADKNASAPAGTLAPPTSYAKPPEEPCCWEKCLIGTCFGPVGPCCACWGFFLLGWFFTLVFMGEVVRQGTDIFSFEDPAVKTDIKVQEYYGLQAALGERPGCSDSAHEAEGVCNADEACVWETSPRGSKCVDKECPGTPPRAREAPLYLDFLPAFISVIYEAQGENGNILDDDVLQVIMDYEQAR